MAVVHELDERLQGPHEISIGMPGQSWLEPSVGFGKTVSCNNVLVLRVNRVRPLGFWPSCWESLSQFHRIGPIAALPWPFPFVSGFVAMWPGHCCIDSQIICNLQI